MSGRWSESADLPSLLAESLRRRPTQRSWRRWMTSQLSYGRHAGPPRADARPSAVAILLYQEAGQWRLPLTVRAASLPTHAGQVSFPGGRIEAGEDAKQAAHRELVEELLQGSTPEEIDVEWLGQLAPLFVFASNAIVTPWVGVLRTDLPWNPNPAEVDAVLELPLRTLVELTELEQMTVERGPLEFDADCFGLDGHVVWGSTGVLLGELRGQLLASSSVARPS